MQGFSQSILYPYVTALKAHLSLMAGETTAAVQWATSCQFPADALLPDNFVLRKLEYLTLVRVLIAQEKPREASDHLEKLKVTAETAGLDGSLVEILALEALARQLRADKNGAQAALKESLQRAAPGGYTATFVDLGEWMRLMIADFGLKSIDLGLLIEEEHQPAHADKTTDLLIYAKHLLAAFPSSETTIQSATPAVRGSILNRQSPHTNQKLEFINQKSSIPEPLSERELEVLRLVAAGKSNQQIAAELVLATGTVKKHLNNIFGKLSVQNRTQCAARARELNLL
jgi:LuxR family transcriptional regulator, maltose regulon positive regulatory protein